MTKRVLSIVIGTEYTKVCEVSYNRNNIKKELGFIAVSLSLLLEFH